MPDEYEHFANKRPDRVYISKAFKEAPWLESDAGRMLRILSKVFDSDERHEFAKIKGEIVLRVTGGERQEVKIVFYEDSRAIKSITIQRFTLDSGKPHKHSLTFRGEEIEQLFNLLRAIRYIDLESQDKTRLDANILNDWLLSEDEKLRLFSADPDLIVKVAQNHITSSDIVALAYRRNQLDVFDKLLTDDDFFEKTKTQWQVRGDEAVWQHFFEQNPWIFGYGLSFIFTSGLDDRKLEQVTSGFQVNQPGKRTDALLKTRGLISSLCFAEIKTHKTRLLHQRPYRPGSRRVSDELAGSVAQVQKTVQQAVENITSRLDLHDDQGNPTGESAFLYQPRSFLVIGSLGEFLTEHGINEQQFGSFELFRRNLLKPEIMTFDELYQRATFIVEHQSEVQAVNEPEELDFVPFDLTNEDIPF